MVKGTFRSYTTSLISPYIVGIDRTLNDATSFIQTSVVNAGASATSAAASEAAALVSQNAAHTSQVQAASSQSAAASSASNASKTLTAVQAILYTLNATWLGEQQSDPTVDNNGNPVVIGATYLNINTSSPYYNNVRIYTSSGWENLDLAVQQSQANAAASAANAALSASNAAASATAAAASAATATSEATIATNEANLILSLFPALTSSDIGYFINVNSTGTQFQYLSPAQVMTDLGAAPLTSPAFKGIATGATAAQNTATLQFATTAFVLNQASNILPKIDGTATIGTSLLYARADHIHASDTTKANLNGNTSEVFKALFFQAGWGLPGGTLAGYSFYNDSSTNTGMFSNQDGVLYFYNNGAQSLFLDNVGNLTVNNDSTFNKQITVQSTIFMNGTKSSITLAANNNIFTLTTASASFQFNNDNSISGNITYDGIAANINNYVDANGIRIGNKNFMPPNQGSWITWNTISGEGYTDFINFRGGGSGGFNWFNNIQSAWQTEKVHTPLMSLSSTGNLSVNSIALQSLSLPSGSDATMGDIDLFDTYPYINFHYNNGAAFNVQIINESSNTLSFKDSASSLFSTFSPVAFNIEYANYLTRLTGTSDNNLSIYHRPTATGTDSLLWQMGPNGSTVNVPVTHNGILTTKGNIALEGGNISFTGTNTSSTLTGDSSGNFFFRNPGGSNIFYINTQTPTPQIVAVGNFTVNSSYALYTSDIVFNRGGTSRIYQDANTSDIVIATGSVANNVTTWSYCIFGPGGSLTVQGPLNANQYFNAAQGGVFTGTLSVNITPGTNNSNTAGTYNTTNALQFNLVDRGGGGWYTNLYHEEAVGTDNHFVMAVSGGTGSSYSFIFHQNGTIDANTFNGTATRAQYADLAELYTSDQNYIPGTLVKISTDVSYEITKTTSSTDYCLGVISTAPAYLMNSGLKKGLPVGLTGRLPTRIVGAVKKGDPIMPSNVPGVGIVGTDNIIGFALESNSDSFEKLVEVTLKGR